MCTKQAWRQGQTSWQHKSCSWNQKREIQVWRTGSFDISLSRTKLSLCPRALLISHTSVEDVNSTQVLIIYSLVWHDHRDVIPPAPSHKHTPTHNISVKCLMTTGWPWPGAELGPSPRAYPDAFQHLCSVSLASVQILKTRKQDTFVLAVQQSSIKMLLFLLGP